MTEPDAFTGPARDDSLDRAKGIAIILVVLGHAFQVMRTDFDHFYPFRIIYSFHMPLFMFLSGAVAAYKPLTNAPLPVALARALEQLRRGALRLLLPFSVWVVLNYWLDGESTKRGLLDWLFAVAYAPQISLWFLPALFECLLLWNVCGVIGAMLPAGLGPERIRALLSLIFAFVFFAFGTRLPDPFGAYELKTYFPYFAMGAAFYLYAWDLPRGPWRSLPYLLFVVLVPSWYRMEAGRVAEALAPFVGSPLAYYSFRITTALCGTLMVLDIAKHLRDQGLFSRALAFCGVSSLGIYVFHGHFLRLSPPFLMPLALSLGAVWVVRKVPSLGLALLGERPL